MNDAFSLIININNEPFAFFSAYIQEIGRCGRDGLPSTATLFYNRQDVAPNKSHLHSSMKEYCDLQSCRREFLINFFGFSVCSDRNRHICCDNCRKSCTCSLCNSCISHDVFEKKNVIEPLLKQWSAASLSAYFQSENALSSPIMPEVRTGLSKCLIDILSNSPRAYSAFDNIEKSFPFLKPVYVSNISNILDATVRRYDHSQACEQ